MRQALWPESTQLANGVAETTKPLPINSRCPLGPGNTLVKLTLANRGAAS
ncbi:MAG: hypothetical protein JNM47_16335 [Hyphomonadaceae bacterium]|nr:hypothetical protein [Hyphomonadaceae bacterium]